MADLEQKLVTDLRALVISAKGGLQTKRLYADYRDIGGSDDFKSLGYTSLVEFVGAHPRDFRVANGLVTAVADQSSEHIMRLVSQQKTSKSKGKSIRRPIGFGGTFGKSITSRRPSSQRYAAPPRFQRAAELRRASPPPQRSVRNAPPASTPLQRTFRNDPPASSSQPKQRIAAAPYQNIPAVPARERIRPPHKMIIRALAAAQAQSEEDVRISRTRDDIQGRVRHVELKTSVPLMKGGAHLGEQNGNSGETSWAREVILVSERQSRYEQPFTEYRAKEPKPREPYHHRSIEPSSSSSSNYGGLMNGNDSTRNVYYKKQVKTEETKELVDDNASYSGDLAAAAAGPQMPLATRNNAALRLMKIQAENKVPSKVDVCERLASICMKKGLPVPDYENVKTKLAGVYTFTSIIKINDNHYGSGIKYTEEDARISAANKALAALGDVLLDVEEEIPEMADLVLDEPTNKLLEKEERFLNDVVHILKSKPGIWFDMLPESFIDACRYPVPENWQDLVENCPLITVSLSFGKKMVQINHNPPVKPAPNQNETEVETASSVQTSESDGLPPLVIPDGDSWDVYAIYTASVCPYQFWCRFIGEEYSESYDELTNELELSEKGPSVDEPELEEMYAAFVDNDWHRVSVLCLLRGNFSVVYFVDEGEQAMIDNKQLFPLAPKFRTLAPQAFKIELEGLQTFPDYPDQLHPVLIQHVFNQSLVAQVIKACQEDDRGVTARAILWNTSSDTDININLMMMETVAKQLKTPQPGQFEQGAPKSMRISHEAHGAVYMQCLGSDVACMECLIEFVITHNEEDMSVFRINDLVYGNVFLARDPTTSTYRRAKFLEKNGSSIDVIFIDYGPQATVSMADLLAVEKLCPVMAAVPPLALKVPLYGAEGLTEASLARLRAYISINPIFLVKLGESTELSVELWQRCKPSDRLTLINVAILQDHIVEEVPEISEDEEDDDIVTPDVELPTVGDLFNVTVTMAASPYLFTVQPADHAVEIRELMTELQEVCNVDTEILPSRYLKIGRLVAVLYTDKHWYRAKIKALIGLDAVSVELCDYGNLFIVTVENLRVLPPQFRALPCLAIRARLHGVVPLNGDWTPSDCVFFQENVLQADLASVVHDISTNDSGAVLHLALIDTSSDNDLYISQMLIQHGIAIETS